MTIFEHICTRLTGMGLSVEKKSDGICIKKDEAEVKLRADDEWEEGFRAYSERRGSTFEVADWVYSRDNLIEMPVVQLDSEIFRDADSQWHIFNDGANNKVVVGRASIEYSLAHFDSELYERFFFGFVWPRVTKSPSKYGRQLTLLFRRPLTAQYIANEESATVNLKEIATERIRACLVKLAIERHTCYEIFKPRPSKNVAGANDISEFDGTIPRVSYEHNVVSYYKLARSSPFPGQKYLAYYHVLEYYFLRVAEDSLHHQLKTLLNRTSFRSDVEGLDKLISMVRRQDSKDDETEMLRKVLQRFAVEEDFIAYVTKLENSRGEKIYTKRRQIFGEQMEIALKEGHAISNAAKVIKHIRNAIVHSSDRYKREECHIPLTDSEDLIADFIPIVRYFAEQVIYGSAIPQRY